MRSVSGKHSLFQRSLALVFLTILSAHTLSGCRLESKNDEKLAALKNGYLYDEDSSAGPEGTISINAGSSATTSTSVTLTIESDAARDMYVTNDEGCETGGTWETYSKTKSWTLAQTNATATVYVRLRAPTGKLSDCLSDSIRHDTMGPPITISAPSQSSVNSGTATYTITYDDAHEITLQSSDLTLTKTGTANATMTLTGSGATRTVTLSSITGKGTFKISIAAGTAIDSLGNLSAAPGPSATVTVKEATSLVGGYQHYCATLGSDEVQCWGTQSGSMALGNNSETDSASPVKVQGLEGVTISKLHGGGYFNCVLLSDQTVRCWGDNAYGQIGSNISGNNIGVASQVLNSTATGPLSGVTDLAIGGYHACALLNDQTVECWGLNSSLQLGDNTNINHILPAKVKNATGTASLTGVLSISGGTHHTCVKLSSSDMRCWGINTYGNLGDNTGTNRKLPVQVKGPTGTGTLTGIDKLFTGNAVSCAIHPDQTASCWGFNDQGGVGNNSYATQKVPTTLLGPSGTAALSGITQMMSSPYSSVQAALVGAQNQLYLWGAHLYGQLGNNTLGKPNAVANPATGSDGTGILTGVTHFAGGNSSSCALFSSDKQVRCWGYSYNEEIGRNAPTLAFPTPLAMKDATGTQNLTGVSQVEMGGYTTCVLVNGSVQCWGLSTSGSLGDNTTLSSLHPVQVSGLTTGISAITVGSAYGCAIRASDSTLHCWGDNAYGQLGQNGTSDSKIPLQVKNTAGTGFLSGVTHVAATPGYQTTCAIADGVPHCWGLNTSKQAGNNTVSANVKLPNAVLDSTGTATLSGATAIATENGVACAIIGGAVYCWGSNGTGRLGNNTNGASSGVALQVQGLTTGVTQISIGTGQACALKDDGTAWCWGDNDYGQLGRGDFVDSITPVQVQGLTGTPTQIMANADATCALVSGGIQCWGRNAGGSLGTALPAGSHSATPVWISGAHTGATAMYHGRNYCAKVDGLIKCWGSNAYGRLQQPEAFTLLPQLINPWAE